MKSYIVIITCRDGQATIGKAIQSWLDQTCKPKLIIVVNDGSKDHSQTIIEKLQDDNPGRIAIIPKFGTPYDIRRIAINWNDALDYADKLNITYGYHVIATEDTIFKPDYAEQILTQFEHDPLLFAMSGNYPGAMKVRSPRGAGRFVDKGVFNSMTWQGRYPYQCGFESAIIYEGMRLGFRRGVCPDAIFEHTRALGTHHGFKEFAKAMKLLGWSPPFALLRCCKMAIKGQMSASQACRTFLTYLEMQPEQAGYYAYFHKELRQYIQSKLNLTYSLKIKLGLIRECNP